MAAATDSEGSVGYQLFILVVSVLAMVLLAVEVMARLDPATVVVIRVVDAVLCAVFLIDFVHTFTRSRRKLRYLATWGWLDLLSSVPLVSALRFARLARVVRILRVLRGIRSARELAGAILEHRTQSAFLAAGLLAAILVVVGSIAILQFEDTPLGNIKQPEDALWWSTATLTTTGSADRYPVTRGGRIVAVVLNVAGIVLFGAMSGFFASWFLGPRPRDEARENEMNELRREVRSLREAIEKER